MKQVYSGIEEGRGISLMISMDFKTFIFQQKILWVGYLNEV